MEEHLKLSCSNSGLELVYTNNKFTLLSSGIENNLPTIRAHKIFKSCSKEIASAVVNYYTSPNNKESYLKIIEDYFKKEYPSSRYKIKAPNEFFNRLLKEKSQNIKNSKNDEDSMLEIAVLSITQKDFSGSIRQIDSHDTIKSSVDDPIELDIIISPFNT